jgi:hypothetical protein
VPDRIHHTKRLVLRPASIGVRNQNVPRLQFLSHRKDTRNIRIGIAADLELELGVVLTAVLGDHFRHFFRGVLRDGAIEREIVAAVSPAEQRGQRLPRRFSENVPAGNVDGRFHIRMPAHGLVHALVERP